MSKLPLVAAFLASMAFSPMLAAQDLCNDEHMKQMDVDGVCNLLRRGLDCSYVEVDEDLTRPRGRIRLSDTLARQLLGRAQIACTTDNLSPNVLHNQIIKTTLERLMKTNGIDAQFREGNAGVLSGLSDIRSISLTARDFGRVQLHGNNASYGFLLRVCALAYEALLPEPGTGRFHFRDVLAEPQKWALFSRTSCAIFSGWSSTNLA